MGSHVNNKCAHEPERALEWLRKMPPEQRQALYHLYQRALVRVQEAEADQSSSGRTPTGADVLTDELPQEDRPEARLLVYSPERSPDNAAGPSPLEPASPTRGE